MVWGVYTGVVPPPAENWGLGLTAYGYRLHQVVAHPGHSRRRLPLSKLNRPGESSPVDALELLQEQLGEMVGRPLVGSPAYVTSKPEPADTAGDGSEAGLAKRKPMLFLRQVSQVGRRLDLQFEYGIEGDYESLLDVSGISSSMKGKAGGRVYRVWILLPQTGDSGVMISEVKGRTYVGEVLFRWLRCLNQNEAVTFDGAGNQVEQAWTRWMAHAMFDPERFSRVEQEATGFALTLTRHSKKASGEPDEGTVKVRESGIGVDRIEGVMAVMLDWWNNRYKGTKEERSRHGAEAVEALVHVGLNDEFDDGEISFKENNKQQTITPNTVDRLFIYPLGDVRPSSESVLGAAKTRLPGILSALDSNIDLEASI